MTTTHPEGKPYNVSTYSNYGCRCNLCRAANTEAKRAWRAKNGDPPPTAHGVNGYTNYGCRCHTCRRDHSTAAALRRRLSSIAEFAYHDGPI